MKHRARVTMLVLSPALVLSLVLAAGGCSEPAAPEGPPAAADPATTPATTPAVDGTDRPAATTPRDDGGGVGFFLKRSKPAPSTPGETDGPGKPGPTGGLGSLTRELVETARRTVGDPVRLVPDAAQYVLRLRPAVLLAHAEAQAVLAKAESSDAQFKAVMDTVRACLGSIESLDDVVLGLDDASHLVLTAHATGLGTEATWKCLQTESTTRGQSFELVTTGTARGEGPQLRATDGDDVGYFVDADTVVLVSTAWDADVQALLRSEGRPAIEAGLAAPVGRIHQADPLWLAGRITGTPALGLAGTPMSGIVDVAVDLRLEGADLLVTTSVDAGEPADATRMRDEVQTQVDQFESLLPAMGLPATIGPKLAFVAKGDVVELELSLTGDELRGMREGIERTF